MPVLTVPLADQFSAPTTLPAKTQLNGEWETSLSRLLGLGRAAGADFIEFFLERVNYISCMAEEDAITSLPPKFPPEPEFGFLWAKPTVT